GWASSGDRCWRKNCSCSWNASGSGLPEEECSAAGRGHEVSPGGLSVCSWISNPATEFCHAQQDYGIDRQCLYHCRGWRDKRFAPSGLGGAQARPTPVYLDRPSEVVPQLAQADVEIWRV